MGSPSECRSCVLFPKVSANQRARLHGWLVGEFIGNQCPVWVAPALQGLFNVITTGSGTVCVRPVDAVLLTAGLDGFRGLGPTLLCGLLRSGH